MSSVQLDGSHTRARLGGESVDYQGRKKAKTSNIIFLCDNQGQMLAMSSIKNGSHHDLTFLVKLLLNYRKMIFLTKVYFSTQMLNLIAMILEIY